MGYDLRNKKSEYRFNIHGWHEILFIAKKHGWKPRGTVPDTKFWNYMTWDFENWNGGYMSNDGQIVTKDDAFDMGIALQVAIYFKPELFKTSDWRQYVQEFVYFCMKGEFQIL